MFNKTVNFYPETQVQFYPQTTQVIEKRALTDESVRLLREMEEKIKNIFANSMDLDLNGLKVRYAKDPMLGDHMFAININGKNEIYKIQDPYKKDDIFAYVIKELMMQMAEKICREISPEIYKEIIR